MTRTLSSLALLVATVVSAGIPSPIIERGPGYRVPSGQAVTTLLTDALTLYVTCTGGSDSNACSLTSQCATPGGAVRKTQQFDGLAAPLVFAIGLCDAGYPGFDVPPWRLVDPDDGGSVSVNFLASTLPDAVGLTSPVTGTASAGNSTSGPYGSWQGLSFAGLTANELRGYILEITAGTRTGCRAPIYDNTTGGITLLGAPCSGALDNTSVFHIRDSVNVTSVIARQSGSFDAGTTAQTGIQVQAGWTPPNRPFQTAYVQFTGVGVNVSSTGSAVKIAGGGGISFLGSRIINRSASAGTSAISMNVGAVSVTNSYVHTGAANAIQTAAQSTPNKFSLSGSLLDGANTVGSVIQAYGHQGSSSSSSAVRILANTSQCNGIDITGMRESQIDLAISGAGASNIGVVAMNQGNASASSAGSGAYLTHMYFESVGTAFKLEGPQFLRLNASIQYGTGVLTVFDIAHGARIYRQGINEAVGYTTYLTLDGLTYANGTDVDALGGDVMSLTSGTAFDSFP